METLRKNINLLVTNFSKLVDTAMIGHVINTQAEAEAGAEQDDDQEENVKKVAAEVNSLPYSDLKAEVMRQKLQASVYSHAMVNATENLLKLVDGLRMSKIIHDADRIGGATQELSRAFDQQHQAALAQFEQLSQRVAEAQYEIDTKRLAAGTAEQSTK